MEKYFIEYVNHKLFVCCDRLCAYISMIVNRYNDSYLYVQFVYPKSRLFYGIKQVIELKNESSSLYEVIDMVVNDYFSANIEKNEFQLKFLKIMMVLMYIYVLAIVTMIHLLMIYYYISQKEKFHLYIMLFK